MKSQSRSLYTACGTKRACLSLAAVRPSSTLIAGSRRSTSVCRSSSGGRKVTRMRVWLVSAVIASSSEGFSLVRATRADWKTYQLIRGAGHEDQRLYDVIGLEGVPEDVHAVGAVQLSDMGAERHAAQRGLPGFLARKAAPWARQRDRQRSARAVIRTAAARQSPSCWRFIATPASGTGSSLP